jgi:O-antigen/teichoic acid export membrane protein
LRNSFLRYRKFVKEFSQVGMGQIIATIGGFFGVRLLTELMAPSKYGELALGMTLLVLVQQLIIGPLSNGFSRFFVVAQVNGNIRSYLHAVLSLLVKSSWLMIGIFTIVLVGVILTDNSVWLGFTGILFLFTLTTSYNVTLDNIQNAARQRAVVAWHQGLNQWLRFLLASAIILLFGSSSTSAVMGYFLSSLIVVISQWYFFRKNPIYNDKGVELVVDIDGSDATSWEGQITKFALPFSMWGIFSWAQMSSDRWALQIFQSASTVGLYSVLYQLGYYPIILLTTIFVQFISPVLYRRVGDARELQRVRSTQNLTNSLALVSVAFTGILTLFVWIGKKQLFNLLAAPEYREVSYLLPWMVLSGGLFASGQISALSALNNNQPQVLLRPKIVTSIFGVLFSFFGAYLYGLEGVVWGSALFSFLYLLWVYLLFGFGHALPKNHVDIL